MRLTTARARDKKALAEYRTPVVKKLTEFNFDYWAFWKRAVKVHGIAPPDAWGLDYSELMALEDKKASSQDVSFMLAYERKLNGAPPEITQGLFNGH